MITGLFKDVVLLRTWLGAVTTIAVRIGVVASTLIVLVTESIFVGLVLAAMSFKTKPTSRAPTTQVTVAKMRWDHFFGAGTRQQRKLGQEQCGGDQNELHCLLVMCDSCGAWLRQYRFVRASCDGTIPAEKKYLKSSPAVVHIQ